MADISKEQALVIGAKHSTPTQFGREFSEAQWMAAVQDIAKLGRNAGLEEAKQACENEQLTDDLLVAEDIAYNNAIAHASAAIESLKDNTP